jgi:hypothetical protein
VLKKHSAEKKGSAALAAAEDEEIAKFVTK